MRKLVVLDVDGVVFRGQFILALARRMGVGAFLGGLWDAFLFNIGRMPLEKLLGRAYRRAAGLSIEEVRRIYRDMPLARGCHEAVQQLRRHGHTVILLSAGVPDSLVKDLTDRLAADHGAGMEAIEEEGRLTGRLAGELARTDGKERFLGRFVERHGWRWDQVVAVGDDRNNLPIMRRAGVSIGFHSTARVRREARFLVDGHDLTEIVSLADRPAGPAALEEKPSTTLRGRIWHREIRRKLVHGAAAIVPLAAPRFRDDMALLLGVMVVLYVISECLRLNGATFPIVGRITRWTIRTAEKRRFAQGPIALALAVIISLHFFNPAVASACILIAALADSAAAVVGERWGRHHLPYSRRKTVEGSLTFLAVGVLCAATCMPLLLALLAGATAMLVESLPLEDWDNFYAPLGAGAVVTVAVRCFGLFPGIGY